MLAEYVIVSENALVASPESPDDAEASTLPCAGLPHGSRWWSAVIYAPGNRCWYKGRRCGAIRFADSKAHGAEVFVSSGSDENWRGPKAGASQASTD